MVFAGSQRRQERCCIIRIMTMVHTAHVKAVPTANPAKKLTMSNAKLCLSVSMGHSSPAYRSTVDHTFRSGLIGLLSSRSVLLPYPVHPPIDDGHRKSKIGRDLW